MASNDWKSKIVGKLEHYICPIKIKMSVMLCSCYGLSHGEVSSNADLIESSTASPSGVNHKMYFLKKHNNGK